MENGIILKDVGRPRNVGRIFRCGAPGPGLKTRPTYRFSFVTEASEKPDLLWSAAPQSLGPLLSTGCAQHVRNRVIPLVTRVLEDRLLDSEHGSRRGPRSRERRRIGHGEPVIHR